MRRALDLATLDPRLTGVHRLRREPPDRYFLEPRTDLLAPEQHQAPRRARSSRDGLAPAEAAILQAVMQHGWGADKARLLALTEHHPHALRSLREQDLITQDRNSEPKVSLDVQYSLGLISLHDYEQSIGN